jgi:sigma-B regulation protein RsbU (phosphoserine phosphatase)
MKILLVDDDPVARTAHSMMLRKQGHEVLEAHDGEVAWHMVEQGNISFVVSDWLMPTLAGTELCRRIRAAQFDHYVYVILCTSKGEKSDLIEGMDAGADDFLVKPISREELRVKVRAGERVLKLEQGLEEKNRELAATNCRLQAAHIRIEEDLKAAAWMQENLLPPPHPTALGISCRWYFRPSSYIAGDIFNFFAVDDHQVGFYILDVTGHGVPAAMLSVTLSMVLTPDASQGTPLRKYDSATDSFAVAGPEEVIRELNRRFQSKDDRCFTMIYGLLDTRTSVLRLAQAGHPCPILITQEGDLQVLGSGGMPVGLWPDIEFDCIQVPFRRGDRLVLYSDGVSECLNADGDVFGEERLVAHLRDRAKQPLDLLLSGIEREMEAWRGGSDFSDDVSLLALEFTGEENR